MLAGNPTLRSFSPTLEQRAINFNCLGSGQPETNEIPNYNCPNGLRAQVFFPSCWDGVNLDSADHRSHMAYPDRVDSGFCPPSHPKRFISIFYEVIWDTPKFADKWHGSGHPFVFSNGDETGYGYHGDFVNGWDVPTLQKAVNECTNDSGNVEDCHVFNFFSDDFANNCKIPASIDEQVFGTLEALPGCNPASGLGANAVAASGCGAPTTISAPENPFVDLTVSKQFAYIGCGFDVLASRSLTGPSQDTADMTVEKCVDFCAAQGFSIAGTEYSTQCYCGNSVPADRAPIPGLMGNCFMKCGGDQTENCGGAGTISLYQKCGATCQNLSFVVNNSTIGDGTTVTAPATSAGASSAVLPVAPAETPVASPAPVAVVSAAPVDTPAASAAPIAVVSEAAPVASAPAVIAKPVIAEPVDTGVHSTQPEPIVVIATATVVPLASVPAAIPSSAQGQCGGAVTVTIAATTVTVTAMGAATTKPAIAIVEVAASSVKPAVKAASSAAAAPAVSSAAAAPVVSPVKAFPTLAPSSALFSNGTRSAGHQHGHKHSHKPSGGYAQPTAYPVPLSTGV